MDSLQDIDGKIDFARLSNLRLTNGPENGFDASQFRLAVKQNVPASIIEKLQGEFNDNMSGGKEVAERKSQNSLQSSELC
jgi:hypothetical protein